MVSYHSHQRRALRGREDTRRRNGTQDNPCHPTLKNDSNLISVSQACCRSLLNFHLEMI
jgi:hypothetical protein